MTVFGGPAAVCLAFMLIPALACSRRLNTLSIYERFVASSDDTVIDLETGYLWKMGPDTDVSLEEARAWVEGLGGRWSMPTVSELLELYRAGISTETWGAFNNTGWELWGLKRNSGEHALAVSFREPDVYVVRILTPGGHDPGQRVWAVLRGSSGTYFPTYIPQLDPI